MTHIIPPRRGEILTADGKGTTRFHEYLERTADTVNSSADAVDAQIVQLLTSSLFELQARLGSGDFLTSDCDSFTVDADIFYADQTEA